MSRLPLRAALVGAGAIAPMHASAIRQAGAQLVGVCDRDDSRAATVAEGAPVFGDAGAMLEATRPDVVHVLTPPDSHRALAELAMAAGAHAIVEKPMALSVADADAMIAAASAAGVCLLANHNYLFKPSVARARRLVAEGVLGEIVHVDVYYGLSGEGGGPGRRAHWSDRLPGGPFTNYLPHAVYLQQAFLGSVEEVSGVAARGPRDGGPSEVSVALAGAGATGTITVSMRAQPYAKSMRLWGTEGILDVDLVGEVVSGHRRRPVPRLVGKALFNLETLPQLAGGTLRNAIRVARGTLRDMPDLHAFVALAYEALATGGKPPTDGGDGRDVVRVLEAIWERMPPPVAPRSRPAARPTTATRQAIADSGSLAGRRVLVTGATGRLGGVVVQALAEVGAHARGLVRDQGRVSDALAERCEIVAGTLTDEAALARACAGQDLVVHCAAVTTNNVPWHVHQSVNVDGTRRVAEAAREAGARRLVHVSSVIVYGVERSGVALEDDPLDAGADPWAYYLRSKLAAEAAVRDAAPPVEVVVVRPGIICRAGERVEPGLARVGPYWIGLGPGTGTVPLVDETRVADGILLALTVPGAAGRTYNLVDEPQCSERDAMQEARTASPAPSRVGLPVPVLRAVAARLERGRPVSDGARPPRLSRFQVDSRVRSLRYDTSRAREELGWSASDVTAGDLQRYGADA